MKKLLLLLPLLLVMIAACQPSTEETVPDAKEELTQLLRDFLHGASVNDAGMHDRFWAEDLIYTSSSGVRRNKEQTMAGVRSAEQITIEEASTVYTAEDIQIQQYDDMAVVAFTLVATSQAEEGEEQVSRYLNSGTFAYRNGQWEVVNWQATRMPEQGNGSGN